MSLWKYIFEFWLEKLKLAITKGENEVVRQFTGTRIPDPPFSSFGPSRDYGMDLCLELERTYRSYEPSATLNLAAEP